MFQKAFRALRWPLSPAAAKPLAAKRPNAEVIDPRRVRDPDVLQQQNKDLGLERDGGAAYPSPEDERNAIVDAIQTNSLGLGFSAAGESRTSSFAEFNRSDPVIQNLRTATA